MKIRFSSRRIIIYVAVIGLLIFLFLSGLLRPVESILTRGINPLVSAFHSVGTSIKNKYNEQTSKTDLNEEIKKLEEEVSSLTQENATLKTTAEENQILRKQLNFLNKNKHKFIMADVVSRGDVNSVDERTEVITIDRGSKDGLYAGLSVVSDEGIIVGKIFEAKDNLSKVYLVNNANCKLAASILNDQNTNGVTHGELGLTIKMEFIPQDKIFKAGDVAITSGLEHFIPRGLVIGKVSNLEKQNNDLWQIATIEPAVNPDELIIVSVLLP
jgi:rod shape-determining protein MreC